MNIATLRSKRVILPAVATVATVAALAVGGTVWSATADQDVPNADRERVGSAATKAVSGGTVVDVETSDDRGEAYEVELRLEDGSEVDVALDQDLEVVSRDTDDRDDQDDADDRALSAAERKSAEESALAAIKGGTVLDVEASDDRGEAYEVELHDADGAEWDVELDADFTVLRKHADD